jgi:hypothetical protein
MCRFPRRASQTLASRKFNAFINLFVREIHFWPFRFNQGEPHGFCRERGSPETGKIYHVYPYECKSSPSVNLLHTFSTPVPLRSRGSVGSRLPARMAPLRFFPLVFSLGCYGRLETVTSQAVGQAGGRRDCNRLALAPARIKVAHRAPLRRRLLLQLPVE